MAKGTNTHGSCNQIAKLAPTNPAATPNKVYTIETPNTYTAAIAKPCLRDMAALSCAFVCPAITLSKIGTMGNTQGVKESNKPNKKANASRSEERRVGKEWR